MFYQTPSTGLKLPLSQTAIATSFKGRKPFNSKAFTLIEVLLYIGGLSVMIFGITLFMGMLTEARVKNQVIAEVEQQGANLAYQIAQMIRDAEEIVSPLPGEGSSTLVLNIPQEVLISSKESIVEVQWDGVSHLLNSGRVEVRDLFFEHLAPITAPGLIRVSFTLSHVNPSDRYPYHYSQNFYLSAAVRP